MANLPLIAWADVPEGPVWLRPDIKVGDWVRWKHPEDADTVVKLAVVASRIYPGSAGDALLFVGGGSIPISWILEVRRG